jgi:hypothetical protein
MTTTKSTSKKSTMKVFTSATAIKLTSATRNKLRYAAMSSGIREEDKAHEIIWGALMDPMASTLKQIKAVRVGNEFNTRTIMSNISANNRKLSKKSPNYSESRYVYRTDSKEELIQLTAESVARGISRPVLIAKILELELQSIKIPEGFKPKKYKVSCLVQMPIAASEYAKLPSKTNHITRTKKLVQKISKNLHKLNAAMISNKKLSRKEPKTMVAITISNPAIISKLELLSKKFKVSVGQLARVCCLAA